MLSSLPDFQKERRFPCTPSRKKNLLKFKRESTRFAGYPGYGSGSYGSRLDNR